MQTSKKSIILTIISASIFALTLFTMCAFLFSMINLSLSANESDSIGLAVLLVFYIPVCMVSAVVNIAPTVISIVNANRIKKDGEKKSLFILNVILAIAPLVVTAILFAIGMILPR